MSVKFQNFEYVRWRNTKRIYVPTDYSIRLGREVKRLVEATVEFPIYYYHLRAGGHVAALHSHRGFKYFSKIDIKDFFYSIHRNRVARTLKDIGLSRSNFYAKWSCVKVDNYNPHYRLPYGFVQSSILASLVLNKSAVGNFLAKAAQHVNIAVYVDDISLAGDDLFKLNQFYCELRETINDAGFTLNQDKCVCPTNEIQIFNCQLRNQYSSVTDERKNKFYLADRPVNSVKGFTQYCEIVSKGNIIN